MDEVYTVLNTSILEVKLTPMRCNHAPAYTVTVKTPSAGNIQMTNSMNLFRAQVPTSTIITIEAFFSCDNQRTDLGSVKFTTGPGSELAILFFERKTRFLRIQIFSKEKHFSDPTNCGISVLSRACSAATTDQGDCSALGRSKARGQGVSAPVNLPRASSVRFAL